MTNHPNRSTKPRDWHGFKVGDKIVMLIQTFGETPDSEEVAYSAGSFARIDAIRHYGKVQGWGVDVGIGDGDRTIVNSFDDRDVRDEFAGCVPFRHAS